MNDAVQNELSLDWPSIGKQIDAAFMNNWTMARKADYCGFTNSRGQTDVWAWMVAVGIDF